MSAVTPDGFQCDDLGTILENLRSRMRAIFGQDINLDTDTIDGQTLGIFAEAKADSDQLAEDVYNSWNPQTAVGVALRRIVQFNGIRAIAAQPSQAVITCGGTVRTHIPIGSVVASVANDARFVTIQDAVIGSTGAVDVAVLSQDYGAVQAPSGTITRIITPVFGWQTVTNALSAVLGRDAESDEELRIRRAQSTATPAQSVPESVYGAIANIPQVTQVRLYENYKGTVDPVTGLPPHSFSVVVQGGSDEDIAAAIWNRASIGATQVGDTDVTIYDIQGFPHVVTFQRPVPVRIYMRIILRGLTGWSDQLIAEMKNNLAEWAVENWRIGDSVIYSRIYESINELPNVFSVLSLTVDRVSPPTATSDITMSYASIAQLSPNDITIQRV